MHALPSEYFSAKDEVPAAGLAANTGLVLVYLILGLVLASFRNFSLILGFA